MANVTRVIFRCEEHGGVRRDKPELPVYVCVCVSRGKNRCFTRFVIVQNQPVIYQSRSNRWRARISQTGKRGEKTRETRGFAGRRRSEKERGKVGPTIFFCHPKTADFRSTVLSGRYLLVALRNKLPRLFACGGATFVIQPPGRKIWGMERTLGP